MRSEAGGDRQVIPRRRCSRFSSRVVGIGRLTNIDGVTSNVPRYRCTACGNLTRFDVTATRRVKEFQHFSVGGDLEIESSEILSEEFDIIECRWCGASGEAISATEPIDEAR